MSMGLSKLTSLLVFLFASSAAYAAAAPGTAPGTQESRTDYPSKPVRMIVGFAPGGADVPGRMLAQYLTEKLSRPFIIDNRPGAAATLAADLVAKAPADGYTLLFATATITLTAVSFPKLPYDTEKDLTPVAYVGSVPFVLTTHSSLPVKTVKEFIALAKTKPGQLNYSSAGSAGIYHLGGLVFAKQTGIEVTHVPYKGTGPAVMALLSGEVQFMFPNLIGVLPHARTGKVRMLAIASEQRSPLAPDLPTMAQAGVPGFDGGTWYGVLAPRGTPRNIINLLNREITAFLHTKEMREKLETLGVVVSNMTSPEQFGDYIKAEINKWGGVIKEAGDVDLKQF